MRWVYSYKLSSFVIIGMNTQSNFSDCLTSVSRADGPIGMFDSGIGGLSVALEVLKHLPNEHILYFADTAHVPYGARSDDEIRQLTAQAIDWLYAQGCKIAVVACNSASAFSLDSLRQKYGDDFPIIGLVPAVKPAVIQSKTKYIGVLATPATFRGQLFKDVIQKFAVPAGAKVHQITCLDLVPLVEAGLAESAQCEQVLKQLLDPCVQQGMDHLVLGCTHYPFLKPTLDKIYGTSLQLVDSGLAVARQCGRVLQKHSLLNENIKYNAIKINCILSGNNSCNMSQILYNLLKVAPNWTVSDLSKYK